MVLLCRSALVPGTASWHVSSALSGAPSMHSSPPSSFRKAETFHSCHHWQPLDWQVIFPVKWNIAASFVATEWYNGSLCFSPVIKVLLMSIVNCITHICFFTFMKLICLSCNYNLLSDSSFKQVATELGRGVYFH